MILLHYLRLNEYLYMTFPEVSFLTEVILSFLIPVREEDIHCRENVGICNIQYYNITGNLTINNVFLTTKIVQVKVVKVEGIILNIRNLISPVYSCFNLVFFGLIQSSYLSLETFSLKYELLILIIMKENL